MQRESRLLTECLYLLSRLADTSPEVATIAQELFNNPAQLKKFLTSASPQVASSPSSIHLPRFMPACSTWYSGCPPRSILSTRPSASTP